MIELCIYYTTSLWPELKPICKLGYKAGIWCHAYDKAHYCNHYKGEN